MKSHRFLLIHVTIMLKLTHSFSSVMIRPRLASLWARKKSQTTNELDWESFEFSESPKWDARFEGSTILASSDYDLKVLQKEETRQDQKVANKMNENLLAWKTLDPQVLQKATDLLLPFVNEQRVERIESVLQQRTRHTRFLFENPANPSNVFACLRTVEAFGVQHVDVIIQSGKYQGKAALSQKRGMRTAMGSAQWLSIRNHPSTQDAIAQLKQEHYRIFASDVNPNARDIRDIDWDDDDQDQPVCIVMGNEERGISQEMRELADETFYLPMYGFAESFNLSVATAITLAHLSAASQDGKGPLRPGDLPEHEYNCLFLKGLINSVPKRRMAEALLKQENIKLPNINSL